MLIILIVIILLYFNAHIKIKDFSLKNLSRFKRITNLVSCTYTGTFKIFRISLGIAVKAVYESLLEKIYNNVVATENGRYIVSYNIKGKTYKMIVKPIKGPNKISHVHNKDGKDVSDLVLQYVWIDYKKTFSPSEFGEKSLTFTSKNGSKKTFNKDDVILN
jgi:hypothetical protein